MSDFNIYHIINPYKPLTTELDECKKQLSNDLEIFKEYTKSFVLSNSVGYIYLLYEIPCIFPNITTLVLNGSAFTMEALSYLLDSLKYLEDLNLTENLIFKDEEISNEYTINYPISLRSLKLGDNGVMMIKDKFNSVRKMKIIHEGSETYEFTGTHQHLPNLITFDYDLHYDSSEENDDLLEFIILNLQLKNLILFGPNFSLKLFDIIKTLKSLIYLDFKCDYYEELIYEYEMPILYNIKHLNIEAIHYSRLIIENNFPNVEELVIEFDWHRCNEVYDLIQRFPKLKSLKLISLNIFENAIKITLLKLNSLEKLEINFNYREGKFEDIELDVSACDKLKSISITKNECHSPFQKLDHTQTFKAGWDYYYFPHKLFFVKIFNK
ncbi:RNI-like protein [Conidiobolus coronatus NRRL 28638]|uniref:RNI-like protein n=1 Tax=Conidiobolus coronatus (strain ATCC 28846 / CBS 209.66 / NRRL 28638) TaxID=796925 RepID=A0A137NRS1_CONC2|nr:RNI-like protein [Conidiobolus coronatus NRRL 28638]|eukprot:KXN65441.1 RNI-like protein [Conidiobolus coronatus NRRL 28638]